jgi:tyrosine-protein phosphatase SIW14
MPRAFIHLFTSRFSLIGLLLALAAVPALAANGSGLAGVPNFHQVNAVVYRGGQPTAEGWTKLAEMGIVNVIDLCDEHSPATEQAAVEAAGMHYISIPMNGNGMLPPSAEKIAAALKLLETATGPVFIHCHKGSDRTGTIIACYRIVHDGWTQALALDEAESYGMSWLNVGMKRYIMDYRAQPAIEAAGLR